MTNENHKELKIKMQQDEPNIEPDWTKKCSICGASPILPVTGMCGPCTFGEAETIDGKW